MCRLINNIIFKIVVPETSSRDYASDKDRFCIYNVMVGKKVNPPKVIFYYWLQAFKDHFN